MSFQDRQQVLRLCQLLLQSGKASLRRFQLTLQSEFGSVGPGARYRLDMGQPHLVLSVLTISAVALISAL